jgi:hypothetical protein
MAQAKMSCGVFARAKGGTCTNLESGNRSILGGYDPVVTGDEESLTDTELKRARRADSEFSDSPGKMFLGLPEWKNFG